MRLALVSNVKINPKNHINMNVSYQGIAFEPLFTKAQIAQIVDSIAQQIASDYAGKQPHFICVLKGSVFFAVDLMRALPMDCTVSFVQLRSYQGTSSSGKVEEVMALDSDIRGKDVIIIEDIIDSGLTMHGFKQRLAEAQPRSIALASLLFKPDQLQYEDARPDYYGAEISKEFVIGYGLDLDGLARNLPEIYKATK